MNKETKLLLISILKAGEATDQQRNELAKAFGLFTEQHQIIVSSIEQHQIIETLLKKD